MIKTAVVTLDDGREAEVDVEVPDTQSLASKASSFLTNPKNVLPLSPVPLMQATKDAGSAYSEADKRYPTENLLPAIGTGVGAAVTSAIPFASTIGAGLGAAGGEGLKQIISSGRAGVPIQTPSESAMNMGKQGVLGAGAELGFSAGTKLGGILTDLAHTGPMAQEGISAFSQKLLDKFNPLSREAEGKLFDKLKDVPAVGVDKSKTVKSIGDIFEKRGIGTGESSGFTPEQVSNFEDAGMSKDDISQLAESIAPLKKNISRISKGKAGITLTSDLATTPLGKYQELGNVLKDMNKPDLTYEELKQVQQRVGDMANLGKTDVQRTPIEKLYGVVYHNLGEDLGTTAQEAGMGEIHQQAMQSARNVHKEELLKNIIQQNTSGAKGEDTLNYSSLAGDLRNYTDDQLTRKFGEDAPYIKALRDVAETHAQTFSQKNMMTPRMISSGSGVREYMSINPHIISRIRTPTYIEKILNKYLGEEGVKEYKTVLFNNESNVGNVVRKAGVPLTVGAVNSFSGIPVSNEPR